MLVLVSLILLELLLVFRLELVERFQVLQVLLISLGVSIMLVLGGLILLELLLVFRLESLELLLVLQILVVSTLVGVILLLFLFVCLDGFLVGGLFVLVLLLVLLELLLGSLVVGISGFVVVVHSFIVVIHGLVVATDGFIVFANCLVVCLVASTVGVGRCGNGGQVQIGVLQLTAGNFPVVLCCCVVAVLYLVVGLGNVGVFGNGLLIVCLNGAVGAGHCPEHGGTIGILADGVEGVKGEVVCGGLEFGGLSLIGQRCGDSHGHCQGGACFDDVLVLLSHNFNLLKVKLGIEILAAGLP